MTPSNFPEIDPFDEYASINMDSIQEADMPEPEQEEVKETDREIQIDSLEQLLSAKVCNTWERGFCDSCLSWLKSKADAKLSYKQKDVLTKTLFKYSMTDS